MIKLENSQLLTVVGGWNPGGALMNALVNAGKFIYNTGKSLGSSLRRISCRNLCPLR